MGFSDQNHTQPDQRGERVASWVEDYLNRHGLGAGELAFRTRSDKRDLQRLITDRSCGSRLEDRLAAYFGWMFVEAVFAPVIGGDPIETLEKELERERSEIAARELRLERLRAVHRARGSVVSGGLRLVSQEDRSWPAQARGRPGNLGDQEGV